MLESLLLGAVLIWLGWRLGNWVADRYEREERERHEQDLS